MTGETESGGKPVRTTPRGARLALPLVLSCLSVSPLLYVALADEASMAVFAFGMLLTLALWLIVLRIEAIARDIERR